MSFMRVHDPTLQEKDAPETYRSTYANNVDLAHQLVADNQWGSLALKSDNINQILDAIYNPTPQSIGLENQLVDSLFNPLGTPPVKWQSGSNYSMGQRVYVEDASIPESNLREDVYLCIRNVTNSTNLNNATYWLKTQNYYSKSSLFYIFQQWVDRLGIADSVWTAGTTYYKNDMVWDANKQNIGLCITQSAQGTTAPLTDTANWVMFDLLGDIGAPAMGVVFKNFWSTNVSYSAKDMVIYQTPTMVCLYVANADVSPSENPPDTNSKWAQVSTYTIPQIPVTSSMPTSFDYPYNGLFIVYASALGVLYHYNAITQTADRLNPSTKLSQVYFNSFVLDHSVGSRANTAIRDIYNYYNL